MPYELDFESHPFVRVRVHGVDTLSDMVERIRRVVSHPSWRPGRGVLIDMREASTASFSNEELHKIHDMHAIMKEAMGDSKLALVASVGPAFGVARMWEGLAESGLQVSVSAFDNCEDAEVWLGE